MIQALIDRLLDIIGLQHFGGSRTIDDNSSQVKRDVRSVYDGYVSYEKFDEIAYEASRRVKRIASYSTYEGKATFTVESMTSITQWDFWVDFNDGGEITGSCRWNSENPDSKIPDRVANEMHRLINQAIADEMIRLENEANLKEQKAKAEEEARCQTQRVKWEYTNPDGKTYYFHCLSCGQPLSVPRTNATLKTRCPICGAIKYISADMANG